MAPLGISTATAVMLNRVATPWGLTVLQDGTWATTTSWTFNIVSDYSYSAEAERAPRWSSKEIKRLERRARELECWVLATRRPAPQPRGRRERREGALAHLVHLQRCPGRLGTRPTAKRFAVTT